jgi:hypothetical protein
MTLYTCKEDKEFRNKGTGEPIYDPAVWEWVKNKDAQPDENDVIEWEFDEDIVDFQYIHQVKV